MTTGGLGTCRYCGQERIIKELPKLPEGTTYDDFNEELLDKMYNDAATLQCSCEAGREWREKQKVSTLSDDALETLTEPDEYLKDLLVKSRNQILMHPELKTVSIKVVDATTLEKRVYKMCANKDGNVVASRTDSTSTADIVN